MCIYVYLYFYINIYITHLLYLSGNRDPTKKKNNTTRLSEGIANNPFLQLSSVTLPSVEGNPFLLQLYDNKSESQSGIVPNIFLPTENQSSHVATFSNGNPFLNFGLDSKIDIVPFNASGPFLPAHSAPVTQAPYRLPYYTAPSRPELPIFQRPFSEEIRPSTTSSLLDLTPIKIGPKRSRSELSEWNGIGSVLRLQI